MAFLLWNQSAGRSAAGTVALQLVTAIDRHDPSLAPPGGEDYVRGVWKRYRRVDSIDLLRTRERQHTLRGPEGSGSQWVSDMLLRTGRGLVVLELSFRSPGLDPSDQRVDLLYELSPERIPSDLLDSSTRARVASDLRERGGDPGNDITLQARPEEPSSVAAAPIRPLTVPRPKESPVIKCLRRAHGDLAQLQRCSRLAGGG